MNGAILGDIIGMKYEFKKKQKIVNFELFPEGCTFTDDTVMTIATADAILKSEDFGKSYHRWGNKFLNVSYGAAFQVWLMSDVNDLKPYNSYGNGSAMRVSPIGWAFHTLDETLRMAYESAKCTHDHVEGLKGAMATAHAIYLARNQEDKKKIKEAIEDMYQYDLGRTVAEIRENYSFDVTCQGSVPESIICFLEGNSYEEVIRLAVSLGGDTDTQGAIAGSIAEAAYKIPVFMKNIMYEKLSVEMIEVVEKFNSKYRGVIL
jgi:ADP-ribosylglycohydrolase